MRPFIHTLAADSIEQILAEAKRVLREVGMDVQSPALRRRLLDSGLRLDANGRLRFPTKLVEDAIASAPRTVTLYDRDGHEHAKLGGDDVHFVPGSSGLQLLDRHTGATRVATTADFVEYVRVADGLPNLAYLATAFSTDDVPPELSDAWRLFLCLTQSRQPIVSGAFTAHGVPRMAKMMSLFRKSKEALRQRPFSIFTITPTGMLRFGEDSCQNLLDCVEWGIPVEIVPVTLMGLIAPVTVQEATVFHMVDLLAGLTMCQLLRPGTPVLLGGAPAAFHMQLGTAPMTAVAALHLELAYVAVVKSLGLPTQAYLALSDAKFLDAQAGAETYGSALLAALAGINSVSGPGMLDYVMVFSLEKLVCDDAFCGQALHLVSEKSTMVERSISALVQELLAEQHLLTSEHTQANWPEHLHLPGPVLDRQNRDQWTKAGSPSLQQRARAEIERLLTVHTPPNTDQTIEIELRRLLISEYPEDVQFPEIPPPVSTNRATHGSQRRQRRFKRNR